MKVSPFCKRFKRTHFTGDTFTLLDVRSSIIRTIEGYHRYPNTDDLKRLEKEPQNRGIQNQKTDKIPFNIDRTILALSYADTVIITGHISRPGIQKVKTVHPINEMIPILVYYSYERKYHKLASMNIPGYQCSNVYINVEKVALMNKDIQ